MNDYSQSAPNLAFMLPVIVFYLIFALVLIIAMWRMFQKAGKPGWASIVPIYNLIVMLQIIKRPGWWILLFLVPFVNIVISIIVYLDLAKAFGKSALFGIFFLFLFGPIGFMILGFGKSEYVFDKTTSEAPSTPPQTPPKQENPTTQTPPNSNPPETPAA